MANITYTYTGPDPRIKGKRLTCGHPSMESINGAEVECVKFAEKVGGRTVCLRTDDKPDLALLVSEYREQCAAEQAAREAKWAENARIAAERDVPSLAAMEARAAELRRLIPADHIAVTVTQVGSADGDPILEYTVDGEKLSWSDVTIHGHASAVRERAWGAFASVTVASISQVDLARIHAEKQAKIEALAAEKAAAAQRVADAFAEAKSTGQPVLLSSYMDDCNDRRLECSTDCVSVYAMPDGSRKTERIHTY